MSSTPQPGPARKRPSKGTPMYSPTTAAEKAAKRPWRERICMKQVRVYRIAPKPKRVRYLPDATGKLRRTLVAKQ